LSSTKDLPVSAKILIRLLLGVTVIFILIHYPSAIGTSFFRCSVSLCHLSCCCQNGRNWHTPHTYKPDSHFFCHSSGYSGYLWFCGPDRIFCEDLPQIKDQLSENLEAFKHTLENVFGISESQLSEFVGGLEDAGQFINEFFTATANTVLIIGFIPVYTFLLLYLQK
jgi:hypothetical protein